jgi:hypothetical protein
VLGTHRSLASGELFVARINSMTLRRGRLNVVNAEPFEHCEPTNETVSDPLRERRSGRSSQDAVDSFTVATVGDAALSGGAA